LFNNSDHRFRSPEFDGAALRNALANLRGAYFERWGREEVDAALPFLGHAVEDSMDFVAHPKAYRDSAHAEEAVGIHPFREAGESVRADDDP
jgi:hypothetical protein